MPLNVPVIISLPPLERTYTVHTDRQRWSAEQLAAEPDGRAALEAAVREGVRQAAPSCVFAGLTEADITVTGHPDGSVAMVGRVLCDEAGCHTNAQHHHFDAAEAIEAKAATDWAAEKDMGIAPGELEVEQRPVRTGYNWRRLRAPLTFVLLGGLCVAAGVAMGQYDYHRPQFDSSASITVWFGENFDQVCNHLAFPAIIAGIVLILFGWARVAIVNGTN